jgi:hypothetical protein
MNFYGVDGRQVPEFQPIRTDGTRICPYNKSHIIRAEKWDLHLMKCCEKNPDSGIVMCKYVYGHHIPKENIEEHEKECYEEHFCNGNKTPFNDKTFIIPNPIVMEVSHLPILNGKKRSKSTIKLNPRIKMANFGY